MSKLITCSKCGTNVQAVAASYDPRYGWVCPECFEEEPGRRTV